MNKSLESKIEERKKQAEKRKVHTKALMAARCLGEEHYHRTEDGSFEQTTYTFKDGNFLITNEYSISHGHDGDMGGGSTRIDYHNKTVFHEAGAGILSYIPGEDWEKKLNKLYNTAIKVNKQQAQEEAKKREALVKKEEDEEKAKWGL